MNQWLKIFSSNNLQQANIVKGMLQANEIPVIMVNKQDSSYLLFGEIEIHVPATLSILANDLIAKNILN